MKRKGKDRYEDGIVLKTDLVAAKYRNPLLLQLIQFILMLFSLYGVIFSALSGLGLTARTGSILLFMIFSVVVYFLAYLARSYGLYFLAVFFGFYLLSGYLLWEKLKNGFWHVENIYIKHLNQYYNTSIAPYIVGEFESTQVITIFIIFTTILVSFIVCQAILGKVPFFIMLLTTIPFIVLPLSVGQIPAPVPFATYVMSMFGLLGLNAGLKFGKKHFLKVKKTPRGKDFLKNRILQYGIGLKTGLILLLLVGTLLIILPLVFTSEFYHNNVKVPVLKKTITNGVMEYDSTEITAFFQKGNFANIKLFPSSQSTGGLNKGKLGRVAKVKYNNETALQVTVTGERETIYLKGFAGSIYDGNSWSDFNKETLNNFRDIAEWSGDKLQPGNLGSKIIEILNDDKEANDYLNEIYGLDYSIKNISIHNVDADLKSIYIPYYSNVPFHKNYDLTHEAYVKTDKKIRDYEFTFYDVNNNIMDIDWEMEFTISTNPRQDYKEKYADLDFTMLYEYYQYELNNRIAVYTHYLQVPEQGMDRLKSTLDGITYEDFKLKYSETALTHAVSYVKEFIQKDTKYTLSPGVLPKGKDFVDYFLFENKVGYCTHYATSAAIVFRMLGIPARYAEGYVIKDDDYTKGKKSGSSQVYYRKGTQTGSTNQDVYDLNIKDANAHAWVEIYVNGFGWVPVEVTPGFSFDEETTQVNNTEENTQPEEEPKEEEPTRIPTQLPTKEMEKPDTTVEKNQESTTLLSNSNHKIKSRLVQLFISIILLVILLSVPIIASTMIRKNRIKKAALMNNNQKSIFYYVLLRRVFAYYNIDTESNEKIMVGQDDELLRKIQCSELIEYMELIKKAKFSKNIISQDEYNFTQNFYLKVISLIYLYKPWYKTLFYQYIKVF